MRLFSALAAVLSVGILMASPVLAMTADTIWTDAVYIGDPSPTFGFVALEQIEPVPKTAAIFFDYGANLDNLDNDQDNAGTAGIFARIEPVPKIE